MLVFYIMLFLPELQFIYSEIGTTCDLKLCMGKREKIGNLIFFLIFMALFIYIIEYALETGLTPLDWILIVMAFIPHFRNLADVLNRPGCEE